MKGTVIDGVKVDRLLSSKWTKVLLALSVAAFNGLIAADTDIIDFINIPVSFFLALFFVFKFKVLARAFEVKSKKYAFVSLLISLYAATEIVMRSMLINSYTQVSAWKNPYAIKARDIFPEQLLQIAVYMFVAAAWALVAVLMFAATYAVIARLRKRVVEAWIGAEKQERVYFIMAVSVLGVFTLICYNLSPIFFGGVRTGYIYDLDAGIKWHSRELFAVKAMMPIRGILYTIVGLPFTLTARAFGRALFFIPVPFISEYFLQLMHIGLLAIGGILLSRMMKSKGFSKAFFLLLYTVSYPVLIFSVPPEKYILATFCVILFMYVYAHLPKARMATAIAVSGTLTTGIVVFPFATYDKSIKLWFTGLLKLTFGYLAICVLTGKLSILVNFVPSLLDQLNSFASGVSIGEKALQFVNVVSSYFLRPESLPRPDLHNSERIVYALLPPTAINWLGVVFIALSVAGFIMNRKQLFARMAVLWAALAFTVLFVIGWQSSRNEMFLTALYFGWAFFVLVFMLFEKLFEKLPAKLWVLKHITYSAAFIVMAVINICGVVDLLKFVVEYYPES